jgi:hypothetical protein
MGPSVEVDAQAWASLQSCPVPVAGWETTTAADLLAGWASHVTRLHAERAMSFERDRTVWNGHDYVATLVIRSVLARALPLLEPELRSAATPVVRHFDELLRSFTEPDDEQWVRRFARDDADALDAFWWWGRIPIAGPVRQHLDTVRRNIEGSTT